MTLCEACGAEIRGEFPKYPKWIDPVFRGVQALDGTWVYLTPSEWRLFDILWRRRQFDPVKRESLVTLLWSDRLGDVRADHTVNVYICHLRRKLDGTRVRIPRSAGWDRGWQLVC